MGDLAIPAPLPAFRLAAQPCATLGCPNVLSAADRDGRCMACHDEAARDSKAKINFLDVCAKCGSEPKKPGERYCVRCMAKLNHAYYVRRKAQQDRAARV